MVIKKLFFSYSRVDGAAFAQKLAVDLKNEGFDVWIDQEDIRAGAEWDMAIEKALEGCDCLLFLESKRSVASNNVLDEVYYALEQRKKVIPVIIHDSKTPYRLQRLQHVDFSKDYDKGLAQLIHELKCLAPEVYTRIEKSSGFRSKKRMMLTVMVGVVFLTIAGFFLLNRIARDTTTDVVKTKTMNANDYAGRWELTGITPGMRSARAMLKVEPVDSNKVNVISSLQFFYEPTNDTLYLSVFNGFAGCKGCLLQSEMKLETEDVAIGSNHFTILKTDGPDGKAGDTVASRGNNESIKAFSTLHFISDTSAIIKVQSPVPVVLRAGIGMAPFVYEFRFRRG